MMAILERQGASLDLMDPLPSVEEYMGILQTCRKSKKLSYANRVHAEICSNGLEVHVGLGNHLVPLYVDCGSISQAQQIFYRIDNKNEHAWTSLIVGFVECEALQDAFDLFDSMREDCIHPSGHTYLALLKACAKLECSKQGLLMHTEITKGGFDTDIFVGNALVDMHAKCGSLLEAQNVFQMLPDRDIVSWNALMTGYADHELGNDVLKLFEQMQREWIAPDAITFVCLLRSCGFLGDIDKGQELHGEIASEGLDSNLYIGSTLVGMYAKCGFLMEARDVFDDLSVQDVILWTTLISGYAEHGLGDEACKCLEEMQRAGVSPNSITWALSLKSCHSIGLIEKGRAIHEEIVKRSLETVTGSSLVNFYVECGLFLEARQVLDGLPMQDAISWTALISGYIDFGLGEAALICLKEMEEGVTLNSFLLACIIRACGSTRALDTGLLNHAKIVQEGFEDNVIVGNNLIEMYVNCSSLTEAEDVFNDLLDRDVVSWSALITGYVEHGSAEEALHCLKQMQIEGLSPDAVTFVGILRACGILQALIKGQEVHTHITVAGLKEDFYIGNSLIDMYAKCGSFDEAQQIFDRLCLVRDVVSWNALITGYIENGMNMEALDCLLEMYTKCISGNYTTYVCGLKACGSLKAIDEGRVMHAEIVRKGFDVHPSVGTSVVNFYLKCSWAEEAREVFDKLLIRDVISWNILIAGYTDLGQGEDALDCLEEMRSQGVAPNAVTYSEGLRSCSSLGATGKGLELHEEIVKEEYDTDPCISNSLVAMYTKSGLLVEARFLFDEMPIHDLASWTALMAGYTDYGFDEEALSLLEQMQTENTHLDAVVYACSLKACGSLGEVDRVQKLHAEIVKEGYEVDSFVGSTLVDSYVKCGSLVEAQEVFSEKVAQDVVSWSALIIGYVEHGLSEKALNCLEKMQLEGVALDVIMFVSGLKACGNLGAIEKGWELHAHIAKEGFENDSLVLTTLVSMYSKCGLFAESWDVFGEILVHDVVSWNALIVGHAEHGQREKVLDFYELMQLEGVSPDVFTLIFCLKACSGMGAVQKGQNLHSIITRMGVEKDTLLGNSLIDMYATCKLLEEALQVHKNLFVRDTMSWNTLIAGYAKHGLCSEALNCLKGMQADGVLPDTSSFTGILKGCRSTESIESAHKAYVEIAQEGLEKDPVCAKALVVVYARCDLLLEAQCVFDEAPFQDAYLWSEMLMGYANQGENEKILAFCARMQEQGVLPNSVAFISILRACGNLLALDRGKRFHVQSCKVGELQAAKLILASALIDMYGKCGSMVDAQQVFDVMPKEDVTGWNALVTGYARQGESDLVFHTFEKMEEDGVNPDEITFLIVLTVCSHAGLVEKGQSFFEAMIKEYGMIPAIKHQSCMLDLFGRTGQLNEAVGLVEDMQFQVDNAVWNSMLGACQKWGNLDLGVEAFDRASLLEENHGGSFVLMSNIYADLYA